jgi:hypothetical protein
MYARSIERGASALVEKLDALADTEAGEFEEAEADALLALASVVDEALNPDDGDGDEEARGRLTGGGLGA